eukprot:s3941_g1.t1
MFETTGHWVSSAPDLSRPGTSLADINKTLQKRLQGLKVRNLNSRGKSRGDAHAARCRLTPLVKQKPSRVGTSRSVTPGKVTSRPCSQSLPGRARCCLRAHHDLLLVQPSGSACDESIFPKESIWAPAVGLCPRDLARGSLVDGKQQCIAVGVGSTGRNQPMAAASAPNSLETATLKSSMTHAYLTSKFQVGSAKSDKINYTLAQKVFHSGDVPQEVLDSKRAVQKKKQPNILGTEKRDWNSSTIADQKIQKDMHKVTLEDLELPPRRERPSAATPVSQLLGPAPATGSASGGGPPGAARPKMTEELLPGAEARGQRAFQEDGLVGTEGQQLQLLAYYAELCEDFRHYQRITREEGGPLQADGAQLLLLNGPPGTGKTRHAVSFARALGLPLLAMNPTQLGTNGQVSSAWASSIRQEISGRDCILFLDEIDQFAKDEAFASGLRQFLDGVCQPSGSKVLVVGTTNRIDRLPADVRHRAELVNFERPERLHLEAMWKSYAKHLNEEDLSHLAGASMQQKATGRDVKHCASLCERETAIAYLNEQQALGYCHGAALSNCPGPKVERYIRCVQSRNIENLLKLYPDGCELKHLRLEDIAVLLEDSACDANDLKRHLLEIRAGIHDEKILKPCKAHSDEQIIERYKFVVAMTGQGPIGKLTGKWFNAIDERGLPAHCVADHWNDWNASYSTHTKDDIQQAHAVVQQKDDRRKRMMTRDNKVNSEAYVNPTQAIANMNDRLRERKIDFQDLKVQFKRELKVEFPQASEERLQAMAQRLLNEKLLADEKMARFPVQHESFRPNLSLTTQDRRYKEFYHPGTFVWHEAEKREAWTCCMNFGHGSRGCEFKVVNPDTWCYQGFERG